ncbi:hypothetical protein GWI33_009838 [Rhynchophorus ferrugineus]|uniref:Uncharacterized protein n=1 Tax=Rhynchophorus ferrugineus TaxID=354439 RepID=A0A834ICW2_RHYFE|nr:hypothetical protein GWI33_009838 [Rhynchophorus ferrugineus]
MSDEAHFLLSGHDNNVATEWYKDMIQNVLEIEEIQPQMLQDIMKNSLKKAESYIANRGDHLEDIIFQS